MRTWIGTGPSRFRRIRPTREGSWFRGLKIPTLLLCIQSPILKFKGLFCSSSH
jgi:hypothetical protein